MRRLPFSHLSSLFRSPSLSHGSSSSPFRPSISSFIGSEARSLMSSLHARYGSDLTGSVQPDNQASGSIDVPQSDSMNAGRAERSFGFTGRSRENFSAPYADARGRNMRPRNFVRRVLEEDRKDFRPGSPLLRGGPNMEHNADIVHVNLMRNNSFITVTDSKGNTKFKASAGRVEQLKGGPRLARYAAEAVAEYVGRESRKLGIKSVVMKVKGFTHFKRKRQAIMSWREGYTDSRNDHNPIVYIEDTTRRAHNGCRLPKKRRI